MQAARQTYGKQALEFDLQRLKFIDESGVNISMTRLYGRAPKGERVVGSAPQNYGSNITLLGALSASGLSALMTVDGDTDSEVFAAFVREVLAPTLTEGDIVVLDNLGAHRCAAARQAVEQRGARLVFLPPYSPDLNPIAMLVKDQDSVACGQGADARSIGRGHQASHHDGDRIGCTSLVQTLWLCLTLNRKLL